MTKKIDTMYLVWKKAKPEHRLRIEQALKQNFADRFYIEEAEWIFGASAKNSTDIEKRVCALAEKAGVLIYKILVNEKGVVGIEY